MRIMEIVSGAGENRAVTHCLLLARELARRGHPVTLVCRPGAWIARQLPVHPVDLIESDLHRWPLDELRRIAAVARESRIEVVHTHMSRAHSFGVLLRWTSGLPCVATAQSRHVRLHWMFNDRVIAVSDTTRRFHRSYNLVRADRIVTIPDFVDGGGIVPISCDDSDEDAGSDGVPEDLSMESQTAQIEAVFAGLVRRRRAA